MIRTALVALAVSFIATPVARTIGSHLGILDLPNERSSHSVPTPRNGGYAILGGVAIALGFSSRNLGEEIGWVLGGSFVIAAMGAVDDWMDLREIQKFVVQCVVAAALIFGAGLLVEQLVLGGWRFSLAFGAPLFTLVWIVGYTNAFNFMDGINGIASTHAVVAASVLAFLLLESGDLTGALVAIAIAGAALGFLPWNFPSGSIFMGDVGSATIGFVLASLVVRFVALGEGSFIQAILPMTPFILDTTVTLVRRIARGERFFSAHRSHFYQRLNQTGWSHVRVTGMWTLLAVGSAVPAVLWNRLSEVEEMVAVAVVVAVHLCVFSWIHFREKYLGSK